VTRAPKLLTEEDRILWSLVEKSARPLHARRPHKLPPAQAVSTKAPEAVTRMPPSAGSGSVGSKPSTMPSYTPPVSRPRAPTHMDQPTLDGLARGKLPIEARVDLHGMTQDEAHALLYSFVMRAHASGARYVLVITGKGSSSGGDGILKRVVPGWLATSLFRQFVSSHDPAARGHGGTGALYVRLRRR
jgi:DNA-nicking Smr family endonuclease